ncbi:MAG TPA: chromosome segregation protein SMC, partial [Haliangiales bacterium]|nr:chromosome segregation protein SMC [Haliangiales bacterium]
RDIELWSASHRFLGLVVEEARLQGDLAELLVRRDEAQAAHDAKEALVLGERAECATEERALQDLTQAAFERENQVRLLESHIEYQEREARGLDERAAQAEGEIEGLLRRRAELDGELVGARAEAARLDAEADARAAALAAREALLAQARDDQARAQAALDAARAEVGRAQADIARHEGTLRSAARRRSDLELRGGRLADEDARAGARADELRREIKLHDAALADLRQLRLSLDQERGSLEARLHELRAANHAVEAEVEALRTELHRRRGRQKALREISDRYEGFARGTRAVMRERPSGVRGLLADVVQAAPDLEPAVEAVLGDRLGSILVDSHRASTAAIDLLKRRAEGRSSFIPVEVAAPGAGVEVVEAEGVRGPMLSFVQVTGEYAPIADALFGDVVVVDSLARALELWDAGVRRTFVTLEGDIVDRAGVVTGGSRETAGAGVLAQKRELRELDEICAGLERDLADAAARQVAIKAELAKVGATLDGLRKDSHQGDIAVVAHEKDLARFRGEAERLAERRAQLQREREEVDGGLAECGRDEEAARAALAAAQERADAAERDQLGLIEGVTAARAAADEAAARVTEAKVEAAETTAARQATRAQLGRLEQQEREVAGRSGRLAREIEDGRARAESLRADAAATGEELGRARAERKARADELAAGRAAHEARTAALAQAEMEMRGLRQAAERLVAEVGRLELRLGAVAGDRRHVTEAMAEKHRVDLRFELAAHHLRPPVGDAEHARLDELRELIERMGEVNLTAVEEYEELAKRNDFLVAQKRDLEEALDQLERAIAKINKTSRRRFRDTFQAVNAKFQAIFPRLFRGGRAELRLTHEGEDDLLDAGVEIVAQPPGKKNSTVELLSGGEKALTAVSLIFAIFLYKPSPFCILDEVDAPLDEANVGRFNDLVREMTDRSQFIVITHNKRTMEIADSLYGITMEEPGCSKMVSVKLRQIGERQAA